MALLDQFYLQYLHRVHATGAFAALMLVQLLVADVAGLLVRHPRGVPLKLIQAIFIAGLHAR